MVIKCTTAFASLHHTEARSKRHTSHLTLRSRFPPSRLPPPASACRLAPAPTATAQPQRQPSRAVLAFVDVSIARRNRAHRRLRASMCCLQLSRRYRALPPSPATQAV